MAACRVLLVDDEPSFLQLAGRLLGGHPDLVVAAEAASGAEALVLSAVLQPGAIVLDVGLPDMTGFEVARRLARLAPTVPVVLISASEDGQYAALAAQVGARGYLAKKDFSANALAALLQPG